MSAPGSPQEAHEQGAIFYKLPTDLAPTDIDPLLLRAVHDINQSGWVWTAECCQGHPDATSPSDTAWSHNTEPYLRLVCHQDAEGSMLAALVRALCPQTEDEQIEAIERGYNSYQPARIYRSQRGAYAEIMVYLPASNAMQRNGGIVVFERFARALSDAPLWGQR